jgi:hypothetical protein
LPKEGWRRSVSARNLEARLVMSIDEREDEGRKQLSVPWSCSGSTVEVVLLYGEETRRRWGYWRWSIRLHGKQGGPRLFVPHAACGAT